MHTLKKINRSALISLVGSGQQRPFSQFNNQKNYQRRFNMGLLLGSSALLYGAYQSQQEKAEADGKEEAGEDKTFF